MHNDHTYTGLIQILNETVDHKHIHVQKIVDQSSGEEANLVEDDDISDEQHSQPFKINTMHKNINNYHTSGTGGRSMFPRSSIPETILRVKPTHKGHQESVH